MSGNGLPTIIGRLPPAMERCLRCSYHVYAGTDVCPHCHAELGPLRQAHAEATRDVLLAIRRLRQALQMP